MADKPEIAEEVRNLLEYARSLGMTEVATGSARPVTRGAEGSRSPRVPSPSTQDRKKASLTPSQRSAALEKLRESEIGGCKRCRLCDGRTKIVFGSGDPAARLMFIGEGPGADEDRQGVPFVGRAGQLLTKIIEAMGLSREEVYIANIVKCRPPQNRAPMPDEVSACIPFLKRQVEIIAPEAIVCLGSVAASNLLGTEEKITKMRGHFTSWQGIPVMPTYHPAYLLRNPNMKKPVWEDMQKVMGLLKLKRGERGG